MILSIVIILILIIAAIVAYIVNPSEFFDCDDYYFLED